MVNPRVMAVPPAPSSLGSRAVEFSRRVGLRLDPEQEMVLERSLGVRDDGRWQTFEVGINQPRQNGKGEILMARELFGLFELEERLLVHSAHEFKTSERHFMRMEAAIRNCPDLYARLKRSNAGRVVGFRYSHGDEAIELESGALIEFRSRTKGGMRGWDDVSFIAIDEAMIHREDSHSSMMPTVRASTAPHGPQIWYAGSAVDQDTHEHGVVWTRVRERGLAGNDPALAYFEWSLDYDHPDEVPDEVAEDHDVWKLVNPAMVRGRVLVEQMERELASMSRRGFVVELLGVGDYPLTDGSADRVISDEAWAEVLDERSVMLDPIVIAFDVSPRRRSSIASAGLNEQGRPMVELIAAREGTGWVTERLAQLYEKHDVEEILCDGFGPSVAIARRVDEVGITVRRIGSGEYAQACGLFADLVGERELRHLGQGELDAAVKGARTRPLVDRWAWSRSKSVSDVGPLVAASIASWAASEKNLAEVAIY